MNKDDVGVELKAPILDQPTVGEIQRPSEEKLSSQEEPGDEEKE